MLRPQEGLPSVRSLAGDLGINLHTVNKTYQLLKQEGFIQIHRQKGAVVQPVGTLPITPAFEAKLERNTGMDEPPGMTAFNLWPWRRRPRIPATS